MLLTINQYEEGEVVGELTHECTDTTAANALIIADIKRVFARLIALDGTPPLLFRDENSLSWEPGDGSSRLVSSWALSD